VTWAGQPTTGVVPLALSRLLSQYQGKQVIAAEIQTFLGPWQDVSDLVWAILLGRTLGVAGQTSPATGTCLDWIGGVVGCGRNGLSDAKYLIAIQAQILVNVSDGRPGDLTAIVALIVGAYGPWFFEDAQDVAQSYVWIQQDAWWIQLLYNCLQAARAGGTRLLLQSSSYHPALTFTCKYHESDPDSPSQGWGYTGQDLGGQIGYMLGP
jgi:hypothetical protein